MNSIEIIKKRRSIRKYVNGFLVPEEDIRKILECAMMAPSARNMRPWKFIVIQNQNIIKQLVDVHPYAKMALEAGTIICVIGIDKFNGNDNPYWMQDCASATENILLSACELGYGSCWCGVYPINERVDGVKKVLKLEDGIPFNLIALGKGNEEPPSKGFYQEDKVKFIK